MNQEYLKSILNYDANSGIFTWKIPKSIRITVGNIAGNIDITKGYVYIGIDGILYPAHRLAWMYQYGNFPDTMIDHINRIRHDNRICNLREASSKQNAMNRGIQSNNTSGHIGVSWDKSRNKWQVGIKIDGKRKFLGRYDDIESAISRYDEYAKQLFGEFYGGIR